jgi:acyl-coenzyme A synthetase/AMP-(fatty) acid ligase
MGRVDDVIQAGGIKVIPTEIEAILMEHPAVIEAAVVGAADEYGLIKPKAFVTLHDGFRSSPELAKELQQFVKSKIAPYNYPRWVEFVAELPRTATGKVQRFKLR